MTTEQELFDLEHVCHYMIRKYSIYFLFNIKINIKSILEYLFPYYQYNNQQMVC